MLAAAAGSLALLVAGYGVARAMRRQQTALDGGSGGQRPPSMAVDLPAGPTREDSATFLRLMSPGPHASADLSFLFDNTHANIGLLFKEWLWLGGVRSLEDITEHETLPIGPHDALIVIDMQKDFVPESARNLDGGRFGVEEGDTHAVPIICRLIRAASNANAKIIASRDYHPSDHCSFDAFPPHCIQGTAGAEFVPDVAREIEDAMHKNGQDKVNVVFKAMHEHADSYGALPYTDASCRARFDFGMPSVSKLAHTKRQWPSSSFSKFGKCMGCAQAPWTGSLALKQSANLAACAPNSTLRYDANAPPDVLAILQDDVNRQMRTMQDLLAEFQAGDKGKKEGRIFVCGLALDFCVLDTCLNARDLGFPRVHMCIDAARAAHVPGLGKHGSGFLNDPSEVLDSLKQRDVGLVRASQLLPRLDSGDEEQPWGEECVHAGKGWLYFPEALGRMTLRTVPDLEIEISKAPQSVQERETLETPRRDCAGSLNPTL